MFFSTVFAAICSFTNSFDNKAYMRKGTIYAKKVHSKSSLKSVEECLFPQQCLWYKTMDYRLFLSLVLSFIDANLQQDRFLPTSLLLPSYVAARLRQLFMEMHIRDVFVHIFSAV